MADKPAKRARKAETKKPAKRGRPRKTLYEEDDEEQDAEFLGRSDSASDSDEKPKKKPKARRKPLKAEKKEPAARRKRAKDEDADDEQDEEREALEERHRSRKRRFETDSERLLQEVRDLALAEKKTQEKLIEKLKRDVTTLSKQAEEERKKRKKEVDRLVAEKMKEYDAKQSAKGDDVEKAALREHIKELEAQFASFKRSTGPDDVVTVNSAAASAATAMQNSEAIIQLAQANKLLEMYRLVTSTDIRLIESADDDDNDDDCTEVECTTTDSATGNQLKFELAVPVVTANEIEYAPSDEQPKNIKVPSYLREELSFSRSEMTKFIRSVLDVVIRKKV